jgi:pimeloyl-ACP methyl ester carboxylesterase
MRLVISIIIVVHGITSCNQNPENTYTGPINYYGGLNASEVSYLTSDSLQVFADIYLADSEKPTIILFHQASANARSEYRTIMPKLAESGFNVLAVDQRSGGQRFGNYSRTVALLAREYSYCETYPDFEASVKYLREKGITGKIIAWGSSYSGSLAIELAAKNKEIAGVMAFSPASGGPMEDCKPDEYIKSIDKPLLLMRPKREMQVPSVANQFQLAKDNGHQTYIAEFGTHGSSMLVASRVQGDVKANWDKVLSFLSSFQD